MGLKWKEIFEELNQIAATHGGELREEDVVEFAKNPETALHDYFTWDDKKAAAKYRLLEKAKEELQNILNKYGALEGTPEFAKIFAAARKVLGQTPDG
jgi:hypothetical protein